MTDTTDTTNEIVETDAVDEIDSIEETEAVEQPDDTEPDTFPRAYVEKLRAEAAEARVKAKDRDELARRLHTALVAADGRLVAADELAFDEAHLEDAEALSEAIGALVKAKPYLAARKIRGDVGQGISRKTEDVDLAGILRSRA